MRGLKSTRTNSLLTQLSSYFLFTCTCYLCGGGVQRNVVIGARKNFKQFLGLNDGLSLMEPGHIYPKGLTRIRAEMAELGSNIGVKVRGYTKMVWLYKFYYFLLQDKK